MTGEERTYRVLVADDSPVGRKLLEHTLAEEERFCLLQATNGSEALELFAKHSPEIVITDWMMPDCSGPELCERIRGSGQRGYTYIILLTSNTDKESIVKGLSAGADDYLTKPFDRGELLARMAWDAGSSNCIAKSTPRTYSWRKWQIRIPSPDCRIAGR